MAIGAGMFFYFPATNKLKKNMNTQNLTTQEKEIYQQPMLKVIAVQTSRSILQTSDPTETGGVIDDIQ